MPWENESFIILLVMGMMLLVLCFACSTLVNHGHFSGKVFMSSLAIGIGVLAWIPVIPYYSILFSLLLIVGMLFTDKSGDANE